MATEKWMSRRAFLMATVILYSSASGRMSTKQDSLSTVLRTVEEHIVDSSREGSIVLPLRLKRQ